jgi:hypothetical protein
VVTVKGRFEKDDVKKQYTDYTPTINTQVNIIKNKILDVFAKKGRFVETNVTTLNTESKPPINNPVNIITRNVKNKPWSALYGSAALGSKLPSSAHKDLPSPATIPSTR